jgi:hypothetical protein
MHRLNAFMTLQTANAFGVSFALRLIDPVPWRQSCARDYRCLNRHRSRATVTGSCFFLGEQRPRDEKKNKKTPNAQHRTPNIELISLLFHVSFVSAVRTLEMKILCDSCSDTPNERRWTFDVGRWAFGVFFI